MADESLLIKGIEITRVKKIHGVEIPLQLQTRPRRALDYAAIYQ